MKVDGVSYNGNAIIYFNSEDFSQTISYPEQRSVQLSEGQYTIQVYIFKNSEINIGATTSEQCVQVPRSGLLGIVGLEEERCFEIEIPSQVVSNALSGGGNQSQYILESELSAINTLEINSKSLPTPKNIAELQNNYVLFDKNRLEIDFK